MKMLGSKLLETERLILHKTYESDLKELWSILCIESVSKYYLTCKIHSSWEEEIPYQMKKLECAGYDDVFTWTIELKEDNSIIGQITIPEVDGDIRDIGWFIEPSFQGHGFAYEAAVEVLKYMFLEVGIKEVKTCCAMCNEKSYSLMEKLGFKRLKSTSMIKYTFIKDKVECYDYVLTKSDFLKELFRKDDLYIKIDIDKEPYMKHLTDNLVLNVTGESGSGKSTLVDTYRKIDCIIIDTDQVFGLHEKDKDNKDVYNMFIKKYKKLPNLIDEFDKIYLDIIEYYKDSNKLLIIDSAQFRNMKDVGLLKGDIIVLRTCINNCFDRCIKRYKDMNSDVSFEDVSLYTMKKKNMYKYYYYLNKFLDKVDKV